MVLETIIILGGTAFSVGFWYFWLKKYERQEISIANFNRQIPPRYDTISIHEVSPAPPYQEETTPPPPIDPPQY